MTLRQIKAEQQKVRRARTAQIAAVYHTLRDLEERCGWVGVMAAIQAWFKNPVRGKFDSWSVENGKTPKGRKNKG